MADEQPAKATDEQASSERDSEGGSERESGSDPGEDDVTGDGDGAAGDESHRAFEEQRLARIAEVEALREKGIEPWPVGFRPDTTLAALRERHDGLAPESETGVTVSVAGRITLLRSFGRLAFATIRDGSGDIQLFVPRQALGKEEFARFSELRVGDYVGATGEVVSTKKGELSVKPESFVLLAKCLRPLPEKWHGLKDPEERGRQRHLDLIVNPEARGIALSRARVLQTIRSEMTDRDFVEVEGPILLTIPAGAAAKPFDTHHRALDLPLYLRIALELPLKRVVVGGLERVFEIGRVFRNEGISPRHNPEFTMMESYSVFDDYHDLMALTEELVAACAEAVCGTTEIEVGGRRLDLDPPWQRITMLDALAEHAGVEVSLHMPTEEIRARCGSAGAQLAPHWGPGKVVMETYDQLVERQLWGPVFVCDHPAEVSPLARQHREDPLHVERFEAVAAGRELANAYTELADPILQRERLEMQAEYREAGDEEAERIDHEFLAALEYGMPPTGGLGLGIDRLVMVLADVQNIRDVILFPTYRPR